MQTKKHGRRNMLKIIAAFSFLPLLLAVALIVKSPIARYSLSIYTATPSITWFLLIISIICGCIFIFYHFCKGLNGEKWWQVGILLIVTSNLIVALLPYMLGYLFTCSGDNLSHLGDVKFILQAGTSTLNDVYPIIHVLIAQLCIILSISSETMMNFIGPLFYLLFILFTFILSNKLLSKPAAIMATMASTVLFCYYYNQVFPMGFVFIIFPLAFYLYFKYMVEKSANTLTLFIILAVLTVFFHPVASFMLLVALIVMEFSKFFIKKVPFIKITPIFSSSIDSKVSFALPFILIVVLALWVWKNYSVWNDSILSVASWFVSELFVKPMTVRAAESFNILGLTYAEIVALFIKMYGHYFIYGILSLYALAIIRGKLYSPQSKNYSLFLYSVFFLLTAAICFVDFFRPLTTLSSGRMLHLLPALFPTLVGVAFYKIFGKIKNNNLMRTFTLTHICKRKAWRLVGVGTILITCSSIGFFSIYPSPYIYQPYWGVSNAEFQGASWFLEGVTSGKVVVLGASSLYRYTDALWGGQKTTPAYQNTSEIIPDHFNYAQSETLSESFNGDRYLLSRKTYIISVYTDLYPQVTRFNTDDFAKLNVDHSVDKLFENGEMEIWHIHE